LKRLVIVVAVLLVTLMAGLFVVPSLIDWNGYRGEIERQVAQAAGRKVRVGGNVQVRLLPTPYLSVADIRIADESGRFARPFAKIGSIAVRLSVPPLLQGNIHAEEVVIEQPEISLAFDAAGRGNWQDFGKGSASMLPASVKLPSVRIERGSVALLAADGSRLTAVEAVNGELSAPSLNGPYKFRGSYAQGGARHDLRVATGPLDAADGIRLKIGTGTEGNAAKTPGSRGELSFDGVLESPGGAARLVGALTGKVELPPGVELAPLDFASALEADASGARFAEITLTVPPVEPDPGAAAAGAIAARTSELKGTAKVSWGSAPVWSASLAAQWLDLDRLMPKQPEPSVQTGLDRRVEGMLSPLLGVLPAATKFEFALAMDEARLANGTVEKLTLMVKREAGVLALEQLSAMMPGQSRVEASGRLASVVEGTGEPPRAALDFAGPVRVGGASLDRLLAWAGGLSGAAQPAQPTQPRTGPDRAFLADGQVQWSSNRISLDSVRGEVAGVALVGRWRQQDQGLDIALDTDDLDVRGLWSPPATLAAASAAAAQFSADLSAGRFGSQSTAPPAAEAAGTPAPTRIDLRVGRLTTSSGDLRDVVVRAESVADGLRVSDLRGVTERGLAVTVEGLLSSTGPGAMSFTLAADTPEALTEARRFVAATADPGDGVAWAAMLPLRMAGTATAPDASGAVKVAMAGSAGGSAAGLTWQGNGGGAVRAAATGIDDVVLTLSSDTASNVRQQVGALLGRALPQPSAPSVVPERTGRGALATATVRLHGPAAAPRLLAALRIGGETLTLTGLLQRPGVGAESTVAGGTAATAGFSGRLDGQGIDPSFWARALGAEAFAQSGALALDADVTAQEGQPTRVAGRFEQADRRGTFDVAVTSPPATAVAGTLPTMVAEIKTDRADASALASFLVRAGGDTGPVAAAAEAVADSAWSDRPVATRLGFSGTVRLSADVLTLAAGPAREGLDGEAPGVQMGNASVEAVVTPLGLELKQIGADFAGGRISADASFQRSGAQMALKINGQLTGARLEAVSSATDDTVRPLTGTLAVTVTAAATSLTPRGLASLLRGQGTVTLGGVSVADIEPRRIDATARALLTRQARFDVEMLQKLLARGRPEGLSKALFALSAAQVPLTIEGGVAALAPVALETEEAKLSVTGQFDLGTLRAKSQWRVAPKAHGSGPALPAVTYNYQGQATAFTDLTPATPAPTIDVSDLERDLTARRLIGGDEMIAGLFPDPEAPVADPPAPTAGTLGQVEENTTGFAADPAPAKPAKTGKPQQDGWATQTAP
jgi:AsmA family/AsmA-like C-terminal region